MFPMNTAPTDQRLLLYGENTWYEGWYYFGRWNPATLDCHGCGCCGGSPPIPEGWLPLPTPVISE